MSFFGNLFGSPKTTVTQQGQTNTTGGYTGQTSQQGSQQQTGQVTGQQTQTTTPNLPAWYSQFLQNMPQQFAGLAEQLRQQSQKPLYGAPQQAQYAQQLNQLYGQAGKDVTSQLASQGALNSGRAGQVGTGLALGKAGQMGNYLAQTPLLNAQNQQAIQQQMLANQGQMAGWQPTGAFGQTTTGSSVQDTLNNLISALSGQSSGTQNQQTQTSGTQTSGQSGGWLQGLLGAGLGALGKALF